MTRTKKEIKNLVLEVVADLQGAKATQLVVHEQIAGIMKDAGYDPVLVEELVEEGNLVEVEYVLPGSMNYCRKSFLLPKGTKVRVRNA